MKLIHIVLISVVLFFSGCFNVSMQLGDASISIPGSIGSKSTIRKFTDSTTGNICSVTRTRLSGGKQDGVELLTIDNGRIQITVIPTRGMSVYEVRQGDIRLGWNSPVEEIVHPRHINLESRGGLGWLEGFNELMVRCGLEYAGHPGTDTFTNNTGDEASMDLTLHGKIGNIPASTVEVIVDNKAPHRIRIRGAVYEKFFYGPKLKLVTEISTVPGSSLFRIEDTLTNLGGSPQEFTLIYHTNFGSSILEEDATISAAAKKIAPMNEHAGKAIDNWTTYKGPTQDFIEEVYCIEPKTDKNGRTMAVLKNKKGNLATSVSWNAKQLPYLTVWKNTASEADGYVTGIEPGTGYPYNRNVERSTGRLPKLKPGQTRKFRLDFGIHKGKGAVDRMLERVQSIQGKQAAKITTDIPNGAKAP
jgi:galactose mutarotase-like enzyme